MFPLAIQTRGLRSLALAGAALALTFAIHPAQAAELVMVERAGCVYCARWDAEVAPAYPRTVEGQAAPLRRHDLDRGQPKDIALERPVRYTPTFLLVEEGREVGRITGYIDNAMFWGTLSQMVAQLPKAPASAGSSRPTASREQP